MKIIGTTSFYGTAILASIFITIPCFSQSLSLHPTGYVYEGVIFNNSNVSQTVRDLPTSNNSLMVPDFSSDRVGNSIELFSYLPGNREPVADIGAAEKTNSAPECRKHKCRVGLTDEEWERVSICSSFVFSLSHSLALRLESLPGLWAGILLENPEYIPSIHTIL